MRKTLTLIFLVTFLLCEAGFAQKTESIVINGSELDDFITKEGYRYTGFEPGRVYFNNNDSGGGRLNYNFLLQTMQFLGPKGDTLVFADESTVKYVVIGRDTFFYDNGFYENIFSRDNWRLLKRHSVNAGESHKLGAFGKPIITTDVRSEDMLRSNTAPLKLSINEEFRFTTKTIFYLQQDNHQFAELSKKSLKRLFPSQEVQISTYLQQNHLNLGNETDVRQLFDYIRLLNTGS